MTYLSEMHHLLKCLQNNWRLFISLLFYAIFTKLYLVYLLLQKECQFWYNLFTPEVGVIVNSEHLTVYNYKAINACC